MQRVGAALRRAGRGLAQASFWFALSCSPVIAATNVSGVILADTTWRAQDGPFEAVGNVVITNGATLTIEAGVTVYLRTGIDFIVEQGALRVQGQPDAIVVLTSANDRPGGSPAPGDWGRLRFLDGTIDAKTLVEHAEIRYGQGIVLESSAPTFNDVGIIGHAAPAMTIDLQSSPAGSGNRAQGNTLNGILVPPGDILGTVSWKLRGIPFVVQQGVLGVGAPPTITSLDPGQVEQGGTVDATVRGARLSGAESVSFDSSSVQGIVLAGGSDTAIPVRVTAANGVPLGTIGVEVQVAAGKARKDNALSVVVPLPLITTTAVVPGTIRRGDTATFTVTGSNLLGAQATSSGADLTIGNLQTTSTQATFTLTAAAVAPLGAATLSFTNPGVTKGIGTVQVTVQKALPRIQVLPALIAIPPDGPTGTPRSIQVQLTEADNIDRTFTLTLADPTVAQVTPLTFTIPAGQTRMAVGILGLKLGHTTLTAAASGLASLGTPVLVTPDFTGINTSYAQPLGVVMPSAAQPSQTVGPIAGRGLGVVVGAYLRSVSPATLEIGTGPLPLVVSGAGFAPTAAIRIVPDDGLTIGAPVVSGDGSSVTVPVTIAATAPTTMRHVIVIGPNGLYPIAAAGVDRILVTPPKPVIESLDPISALRGNSVPLTVRGRNLQGASVVGMTPVDGIAAGPPSVSADGTALTSTIVIATDAPLGARVVTVTSPAGSSSATVTTTNTFTIGQQVLETRTPIAAPRVGVLKLDVPGATTGSTLSRVLGIAVGPTVVSRTPAVSIVGTALTLTINGSGLSGVSAIQLVPSDGIAAGNVTASPAGDTVTVALAVAANAPQTLRQLRVLAGGSSVPFADRSQAQFLVSAPPPRVDSVTPNTVELGSVPQTFTVRGVNFQNAQDVRVVPGDGITISRPPGVDTTGTQLTVTLSVAAGTTPGARIVVVTTPAGDSSTAPDPANTLTLASKIATVVTPISARMLGVIKADDVPPPPASVTTTIATALGVTLQAAPAPALPQLATAPALGAVVGPYAISIAPSGIVTGSSATLVVRGSGLTSDMRVELAPASDTAVGTTSVSADGTQLSVQLTVANNAAAVPRRVRIKQGSTLVPFAGSGFDRLSIGAAVPEITSIQPIRIAQGQAITGFVVRGKNFVGAIGVVAEPPDGLHFSTAFTVTPAGDQITIDLAVDANAPVGARVIRVVVPGAASSAQAAPANQFTVDPK